ncbi:ribonuclease H-like domain-containing protein [Tanacetum coccineum]
MFKHKFHADGTLSRYKARLVGNNSSQQLGVYFDETFSPAVKPATIRTVLSLAVSRQWPIHQLDVKNVFLNGDLSETVYMHQPPGFVDNWYPHHDSQVAYLLIYVDDIILTASCPALLQQIIGSLNNEFDMTDLGMLNYFLGISADRTPTGLFLSQKKYALQLLERAHMVTCNPSRTPVDIESKLGPKGAPVQDPTLYRSLAGGLQYLTFARPDLSYTVQQICLYMHDLREPHLAALKRILRYVQGCPSTRMSTSGYCVFFGDNLLSWSAKRQHTLSRSSAEARYRDVANVVAENCMYSAVYMSANHVQHQRTKHIEIDIHFVRDMVTAGKGAHRTSALSARALPALRRYAIQFETLSVGGRLTLIKSVLTSLPLYHMSLYKAPLGVLRDLESLRRKFFNGADINEKRFSMISWNKILASKQKGGLGVSSFFALNRSLLFKWVWRFLSQDASLWHRLIAVLYGNRSPFVHTGSVSSLSPWNCILKELNSLSAKGINLLALLKKKVGNGANTLFWEDCWINDVPLSRSFPRLYALELKKGITVADKLIDASFVASFRRNPRGGVEEEQLHHLVELVGSISLSPSNDRWAWLLGSSGEFSVHSARTFIDDILLPFVGDVTRWVKVVPIKVNILAWKVCLDKLPTRLNLSLRGIDIPSIICPNCGLAGESCSHLFYSCNLARTLWRKIARWWEIDIPDFSCYEEWIAWFKTTRFSKTQKEMLEGVFYVMWWMIWKFRNQVLFGSSHPRMELLFDDIVSYSFTWCSNRCKNNIDWISWMKCPKSISL